jgi:hypothetical protein
LALLIPYRDEKNTTQQKMYNGNLSPNCLSQLVFSSFALTPFFGHFDKRNRGQTFLMININQWKNDSPTGATK